MEYRRPPLWRRLGPAERAFAVLIAAISIGGFILIADGLYLKAKAEHPVPVWTNDAPFFD